MLTVALATIFRCESGRLEVRSFAVFAHKRMPHVLNLWSFGSQLLE